MAARKGFVEKEARDEILGRIIVMVIGVASRIVWDLVSGALNKKKKNSKPGKKKRD